jgi:hypothetical protein
MKKKNCSARYQKKYRTLQTRKDPCRKERTIKKEKLMREALKNRTKKELDKAAEERKYLGNKGHIFWMKGVEGDEEDFFFNFPLFCLYTYT